MIVDILLELVENKEQSPIECLAASFDEFIQAQRVELLTVASFKPERNVSRNESNKSGGA
jgi:hypothetical protein